MNDWSRDRPPEPPPAQDEIPLQTPVGTYTKPWYKKNGWILGPLAIVVFLIVIAAVVTPALTGSPNVTIRLRTDGEVPLSISPSELKLSKLPKGQTVELDFKVTNKGKDPATVQIIKVNSGPPGVTLAWTLDGKGVETNASDPIPPGATVPGKLTVVSENVDSGSFEMRVVFSSKKAP